MARHRCVVCKRATCRTKWTAGIKRPRPLAKILRFTGSQKLSSFRSLLSGFMRAPKIFRLRAIISLKIALPTRYYRKLNLRGPWAFKGPQLGLPQLSWYLSAVLICLVSYFAHIEVWFIPIVQVVRSHIGLFSLARFSNKKGFIFVGYKTTYRNNWHNVTTKRLQKVEKE